MPYAFSMPANSGKRKRNLSAKKDGRSRLCFVICALFLFFFRRSNVLLGSIFLQIFEIGLVFLGLSLTDLIVFAIRNSARANLSNQGILVVFSKERNFFFADGCFRHLNLEDGGSPLPFLDFGIGVAWKIAIKQNQQLLKFLFFVITVEVFFDLFFFKRGISFVRFFHAGFS